MTNYMTHNRENYMTKINYESNIFKKNILFGICLLLVTILFFLGINVVSANNREKVSISYYNNPNFYNIGNAKSGYAFDLTVILNRYLNWDFSYVYCNHSECINKLKTNKIDLLFGVYKTPNREKEYVFNKEPIAQVDDYICGRTNEQSFNGDYTRLSGKRIGFVNGVNSIQKLKKVIEKNKIKVSYVKVDNSNQLRKMLVNNEIDYFIVNSLDLTTNEKILEKIDSEPIFIMANKSSKYLLEKFDNAIRRLKIENPKLLEKILERINEENALSVSTLIDFSEKRFIRNAKEIKCGVVKKSIPYYYKGLDGSSKGIIKTVVDNIEKNSGLKFKLIPFDNIDEELKALKENKIDVIGMVSDNLYSAQKYDLNLSRPYIASEVVVLKAKDGRIASNLNNIYAIEKSPFGHRDDLNKALPGAKFIEYDTVQDCIDAINSGKVGAAVVTNFNAKMNNNELKNTGNLVTYFATGISFKHCLGFSNKLDVKYLEISDKVIGKLDPKIMNMSAINSIINPYIKSPVEVFFDEYKVQIFLMLAIIIIVLVVLYLQSLRFERAKLRLGDERFKKASQQAQVSYWEYSYDDSKLTFFDDKWVKRHGLRKNVIENYDIEKRKDYFDEKTRQLIIKAAAAMEVEDEKEIQISARGLDGKKYYYVIKISAIRDDSKKLVKALGSILDVTNAKKILNSYENEVKRNEVMGAMLLASFMVNLTKNELLANSDCLIAKKDELIGMNYDKFIKIYLKLIETKRQRKNFSEMYLRNKLLAAYSKGHRDLSISVRMDYNGKLNWIEVAVHVTKDPFTKDLICIIYVRDAKERETLQSALDLAESANNAKSNFLSSVSHEIRTPMNAIMGLTDMALEEVEKNKEKNIKIYENLNNIKLSSEYLLSIINDILEMSRIESGKTQLNKRLYDSKDFIKTVVTIISMRAREKNIEFIHNPDKNLKRYYIADDVKLKKIYINILGNAIKFTPNNGKVSYTSKIISCTEKRTIVKVIIADNGIGISQQFLKHIFEPFSRESGTETKYLGTGLGMAISKNFINMMNGDIKIESEVGKGTTVTLTFAIENYNEGMEKNLEKDKKEILKIASKKSNLVNKNLKILLVEDNKLNSIIAKHVLNKIGFIVELATNGQMALEMFSERPKDYYFAILMDIRMPVMNGIEATKIIRKLKREDAKTIPIIAMTANAFDIDRRNSLEAGMNEHITKPIDVEKLTEILINFIKD